MSFSLSDLIGVEEPRNPIVNDNGTFNFQEAQDWISDNIDGVQDLFGDSAGLHIGRARSGLVNYSPALGLGGEVGGEVTIGVGGNTRGSLFGTAKLDFGVTASLALVAGGDWTAGSYDAELSNEAIIEPALIFGGVEDLQGAAAGIEFTVNVNGATAGLGAVVPLADVDDVIVAINDQITGKSFSTWGSGRQAIADILSDIFPPGSMLIVLVGRTTPPGIGVSLVVEVIGTGVGSTQDDAFQALRDQFLGRTDCFLYDSKVEMWPLDPSVKPRLDGSYDENFVLSKAWTKQQNQMRVGDRILSYDRQGRLRPGRVTRTMTNTSTHILDFWGTGVTPGHVYGCADGPLNGSFAPIMDVLRTDGALMRSDGTVFRSTTGCEVDSTGDIWVYAIVGDKQADGRIVIREQCQIRAGTRTILPDGTDVSVLELIQATGGSITEDGYVLSSSGKRMPFRWTFSEHLPKPEDYILQRSDVTLEEIYAAGEWESIGTRLPPPEGSSQPEKGSGGTRMDLEPSRPTPNIPPGFRDHPDAPFRTGEPARKGPTLDDIASGRRFGDKLQ